MFRVRPAFLSIESMPTYDYRCPNGHDFEHFFRKISDAAAELECPICGALASRRVSGGAGLLFKGSGFYLTDYGKNAHRKGGGGGGGGSDSSGSSSGGDSSASGGDSAKSDTGSATTPKSDAASASKSEPGKSTDTKPSGKTKGSDSK
jgi:putative FmdB family regulatory protein